MSEEVSNPGWDVSELSDRGKKGGPRSKLVEAIAVLLLSRPLRSAEIAQILGFTPRYISSYLSYWKTRGLFAYDNGFWMLTPLGEDFARNVIQREMDEKLHHYTTLALRLISSQNTKMVSRTRKDKRVLRREKVSSGFQQFIVTQTSTVDNKQQDVALFLLCMEKAINDEGLTTDEQEVLNTIINHYIKWGTTYLYLDQLEELMEADRAWLLKTLRLLQAKGLIYIYNDRRLGTRIGFSRKIRQAIAVCSSRGIDE